MKTTMKLPEPKSMINVYHPDLAGVRMRFISRDPHTKTRLICSFQGIEYSVKVGVVTIGNESVPRWEAEKL